MLGTLLLMTLLLYFHLFFIFGIIDRYKLKVAITHEYLFQRLQREVRVNANITWQYLF